ncbi:MAG: DUF1207 domain-containing protein [Turneriella sp.]
MQPVKKILCLLAALAATPLAAKATWLTFDTRPFRPIAADLKEIKFDYILLNEKRVNATIGAHYPILDLQLEGDHRIQTGIFGLGFNRLQIKDGFAFDLNSYDAVFGAYTDYRTGPFALSFRYTHTSTHLSEGYYVSNNESSSAFRYSREHLQLMGDYTFHFAATDFRLIGGFTWVNASVSPVDIRDAFLIGMQAGFEVDFPRIGPVQPFASFLAYAQTENNYRVNKSLAFGLKLRGESASSFRIMAQYFEGIDPRGNFYLKNTEFWGLGIAYFL